MTYTVASLRWLEAVLEERYGHRFALIEHPNGLCLKLPGTEGAIRFDTLQPEFHQSRSDFPCGSWDACREGFTPALGKPLPTPGMIISPVRMVEQDGADVVVHYDLLGLTYWMLSRLEEVGRTDLDSHQRFPATSSHAFQHGYLERPIVDEWLIILGQVVKCIWPQLEMRQHEFSIRVSHDVDSPSLYAFKPWLTIGRMMAGHLLKRHNLKAFVAAPYVKLATHNQLHSADPCNTFDWLMDVSETNNLQSAFYFICGRTHPIRDSDYEPEHPVIRQLMRRIHERGHEIGLHPSYGTYQQPQLIRKESDRLRQICMEENIEQERWGGRMHYLRWEQPTTLRAWDEAGMNYDSTLGYADRPGFRCGTCHEYPGFDPVAQQALALRVRPLVVMECTVMADQYLGSGTQDAAFDKFKELKESCRKMKGCFSFLWHNSLLNNKDERELYKKVLM